MMELEEIISKIGPADHAAGAAAQRNWDSIAKPLGSLGLLEKAVVDIAALTGSADVHLARRTLLVFCADNGVVAQGVTQCGSEVTASVALALSQGSSTVSPMAHLANCRVIPVDVGMATTEKLPGVLDRRIRNGTADISLGPAMSREECILAIRTGAQLVMELAEQGTDIIAVGEMGIGNTTTAAAVTAALLETEPEKIIGRGAGLSDEGLDRKIRAVKSALAVNMPNRDDPIDVLAKVGGLDIASMCGAFLGSAAGRVPILVDGLISAVAALCAQRLCPNARQAMLASHISAEPAGKLVLNELGMEAPIAALMRLGEGSGAMAVLPLLDMALAVYHSGQTFDRLGIEAYVPQN